MKGITMKRPKFILMMVFLLTFVAVLLFGCQSTKITVNEFSKDNIIAVMNRVND